MTSPILGFRGAQKKDDDNIGIGRAGTRPRKCRRMHRNKCGVSCSDVAVSFMELLKECTRKKDVREGRRLHAEISKRGLTQKNPYIASSLINMYCKCLMLEKAQQLLEDLPVRDVVCWSALISGYAREGRGHETLHCFSRMCREGVSPNGITYICVLKACAITGDIVKGEGFHDEILARGLLQKHIILGNSLVDMYAKCGALSKARQVLEGLPARNAISWNALIAGYAQHEQGHEALDAFARMQQEGHAPDEVTFTCALKACASIGAIDKGKQIHDGILHRKLMQHNIMIGNALVDMYAKCGALNKAQEVLENIPVRNVVSWNALISGCIQHNLCQEALDFFEQMQKAGTTPNDVTFTCILNACGNTGALGKGEQIHDEIACRGLLKKNIVLSTALVDMYSKCGMPAKAQHVLEELPLRDIISWSALIAGYTQHEQNHEALNCFEQMQREGLFPNEVTYTCILKSCGNIGAIDKGKQIHGEIVARHMLEKNTVLGTALVDMYAKCGVLAKAQEVMEELHHRDTVAWNALITGYAQEGYTNKTLNCFEEMLLEGLIPNEISFTGVLNACSHLGKPDEAQFYYEDMIQKYGITPNLEHDTCMVVVYGCAGRFEKAISVIKTMPSIVDPSVWLALLVACRKWGNVKLSISTFDQLVQLDENLTAAYVVMANIYAAAGMKEDEAKVEAMIDNDAWKFPQTSVSVDASGDVHSFFGWECKTFSNATHL